MIDKLSLLSGSPVSNDKFKVYPFKLSDIRDMGERTYGTILTIILVNNADIEDEDEFDIFLASMIADENYRNLALYSLSVITREEYHFNDKNGNLYVIRKEDEEDIDLYKVTKEDFSFLRKCLREQNYISDNDSKKKYKAKNKKAEEIREKLKKNREKTLNKKEEDSAELSDTISIVASYSEGVNIFNVWDLTVFQLYELYVRLQLWDDYHIMQHLAPHLEKDTLSKVKHWSTKIDQLKNKEEN